MVNLQGKSPSTIWAFYQNRTANAYIIKEARVGGGRRGAPGGGGHRVKR